jgi:hypothetical protein
LKQAGGGNYFDELLARIRDIRSSEKVFWRKVLDIYATDYDPSVEASERFFATVQNKMHWAAHGHTAAEIIADRADATRPTMGLTSWSGGRVRKTDVTVAKNYLSAEELDALNRIVTAYRGICRAAGPESPPHVHARLDRQTGRFLATQRAGYPDARGPGQPRSGGG